MVPDKNDYSKQIDYSELSVFDKKGHKFDFDQNWLQVNNIICPPKH